jgi:hypothetical protein
VFQLPHCFKCRIVSTAALFQLLHRRVASIAALFRLLHIYYPIGHSYIRRPTDCAWQRRIGGFKAVMASLSTGSSHCEGMRCRAPLPRLIKWLQGFIYLPSLKQEAKQKQYNKKHQKPWSVQNSIAKRLSKSRKLSIVRPGCFL